MNHQDDEHTRASILRTQRLIGGVHDLICRYCDEVIINNLPHAGDCLLRKIDPEGFKATIDDVNHTFQKNLNKQRIFKSDHKPWSGLPPTKKTLVKRRGAVKNRGPHYEIKWCKECSLKIIFMNHRCSRCEHGS